MCDTLIALKSSTIDNVAIFGKNSDRPPNEGQHLAYFPAQDFPAGSRVKCTYIDIPQVKRTNGVLLSKPFWMWGGEIGVNEHGLVIGNEAVFSKITANRKPALLGMDMLRAALERAKEPREAMQVIIDLLEEFGQGGNCIHDGELYYHNSFIIANADDAWVLETVDKQWAAKQLKDVYSISNCLTLNNEYDIASSGLAELAIQKGLSKSGSSLNIAKDYSDFIFTKFSKGRERRGRTICALEEQKGKVSIESMMGILRSHKKDDFDPRTGLVNVDVCMHAGFGPIRVSQTTASMIVYLDRKNPLIFATGTAAPCTGIFKPFWMDTLSALDSGTVPGDRADSSLYWTHEKLHRAVLLNYPKRIKTYAADRDQLEKQFMEGAFELHNGNASADKRSEYSRECFARSAVSGEEWLVKVGKVPAEKNILYGSAWKNFNKKAGMSIA
jgi:dipeptidase